MKLRKLYNRLFCRLDKTDFTQEEATEIYERTNALLIDVRTPEEYRENHIEGAVNIPVYEIDNLKNEIIDPNKVILVYCKTGKRSKIVKQILIQNGYKNVYTFSAKV
ncbi:MAG: rhodanese-like domain-containing protein [Clostridium sp.]|jgi:phage shock protein E|nr:rhodanese-like domain-containing protein [Clostridium sp.]